MKQGSAANSSNRRVLVIHTDGSQEIVEIKDDFGMGGYYNIDIYHIYIDIYHIYIYVPNTAHSVSLS